MSRISNKQLLAGYNQASIEEKNIYLKLLYNDTVNVTHFLQYWIEPERLVASPYTWVEQVKQVLDTKDFEQILQLQTRLSQTAHAINQLRKHMQKLAERQTND
ncbi:hypothetical protein CYJ25_08800 [Schaalia turicensis]|uniref:Uncharacterized protein n=1 Tax=Schaalia turicensis TaxID=131111 RepID=A0A2I1I375_9ACTO|nr:hypothetical protein [Schaalia turicensis]PKY65582.1 hypothetical protein CYJ25_08800 [Schaalia turicensis]